MGLRLAPVIALSLLLAIVLLIALEDRWSLRSVALRSAPNRSSQCEACTPVSEGLDDKLKEGEGERVQVSKLPVEDARELIERAKRCEPPKLGEGGKLILKYRFLKDTLVECDVGASVADLLLRKEDLSLVVIAERIGSGYVMRFRLEAKGEAVFPRNGSKLPISFAREVELLYDPERGYRLLNGTELGHFFPLFARPDRLELQVMWAKLGEPYSLARMRRASAQLKGLGVLDLERGVGAILWPNGTLSVVHSNLLNESLVRETLERTKARRELGCPNLLGIAIFVSDEFTFKLHLDYIRGVPVRLLARGALRSLPTTTYEWMGERADETPALPLAELLRIRDYLAIELDE